MHIQNSHMIARLKITYKLEYRKIFGGILESYIDWILLVCSKDKEKKGSMDNSITYCTTSKVMEKNSTKRNPLK